MHQLFIVIPATGFLIAVIVFILYRRRMRTGKSDVSAQKEKCEVTATQRREYFRADVLEPEAFIVTLELDTGSLTECRLMNICIGGAGVLAVRHPIVLEIGSRIKELKVVFLGGEEIKSPAIVKYVLRKSDSDWNRYGIQFIDLSDAQSSIIAKYVIQLEAKKIKKQRTMPDSK